MAESTKQVSNTNYDTNETYTGSLNTGISNRLKDIFTIEYT